MLPLKCINPEDLLPPDLALKFAKTKKRVGEKQGLGINLLFFFHQAFTEFLPCAKHCAIDPGNTEMK